MSQFQEQRLATLREQTSPGARQDSLRLAAEKTLFDQRAAAVETVREMVSISARTP